MNESLVRMRYLVFICLVAALGGFLFGYDTAVIAGAIGFMEQHFGLSPAMKGWAASSALLGCVLGVSFAGALSDRWGRKTTLVLAGVLFLVSAIGTAWPGSFSWLVVFRVLGGVGVGVASMASPMYIAEVTPAAMRGRMVSVNQFAIVTGMLLIYFVNYFIAHQGDAAWNVSTGWRWMFASGAVPAALFLACLCFVPESPRWMVEQGREDRAREILNRVGCASFAEAELRGIREAVAAEPGSMKQFLQPGMRRLLGVGVALAVLQQVTGINVFLYYAPEIFKQLGSATNAALLQTIVVGGVNLAFTVVAIWTVDRWGRKPLMLSGAAGMGLCLAAMGLTAHSGVMAFWMLGFILGYIACFALSVGPVTWVILSEMFPTRIRGRALSLATFCLWTANFIVSQTFPMMDSDPWLVKFFHHGFPFYVYALFCVVLVVLVARCVPETKGRSLEEIEQFWR